MTSKSPGAGVDPNAIYFTAGRPEADMPDVLEKAGLFGILSVVPEPGSLALLATGLAGLMWCTSGRGGAPDSPKEEHTSA